MRFVGKCRDLGNAVVWGNNVVGYTTGGTPIYGDSINWSRVKPDAVVWGNLADVARLSPARSENLFTPVF